MLKNTKVMRDPHNDGSYTLIVNRGKALCFITIKDNKIRKHGGDKNLIKDMVTYLTTKGG